MFRLEKSLSSRKENSRFKKNLTQVFDKELYIYNFQILHTNDYVDFQTPANLHS